MDAATGFSSSRSCGITLIQAKNVEFKSYGNLFVRCYLSAGHNQRIQLNSKEISSKSNLFWNVSFSLEYLSSENSINTLKQESVVFELRRRNTNPILGKIGRRSSSKLVGRAEIPWRTVVESPTMEMEKWVVMVPKKTVLDDGAKPPAMQIAMRVEIHDLAMEKKKRNGRFCKREDEECKGCNCQNYEIFTLAAAFEAL